MAADFDPAIYGYAHSTKGVAIKTVPKCGICQHACRGAIEDIAVVLSEKGQLADGTKPTLAWWKANSLKVWGRKFSPTSVATHRRQHWAAHGTVTGSKAAATDTRTAVARHIQEHGIKEVPAKEFLKSVIAAAQARVIASPEHITVNDGLQAARVLAQQTAEEEWSRNMTLLGTGLAGALAKMHPNQIAGQVPEDAAIELDMADVLDVTDEPPST